ncbi:MAG: helicase-related protein [Alphaproteobacteria bacterium]
MRSPSIPPSQRSRGVTAILGPTNTGKTHLAIERMLAHPSGIIGLPLRLLAREVYERVIARVGAPAVALITGEEKIKPPGARYYVATVEAMPRDVDVSFVAIDECQLAADFDRGHIFTDRVLNMRGRDETMLIGAETIKPLLLKLIPGLQTTSRPRLSQLTFAGDRKISRLPRRSAIVAFSADEVYAIAELIRRQSGGAAVVLGALSPRTRNAQVALYQSGDVDYLVATDAIGMGLNLDVDHVAFAGDRKYDGTKFRRLVPGEFGQIAGRAGRYLKDGTFGSTGRCAPFEDELVEALESHVFPPLPMLQWRNPELDFSSVPGLIHALDRVPDEDGLTRAPLADDLRALEAASRDRAIMAAAKGQKAVELLWAVCQVPDYRKLSPQAHADLVTTLYLDLATKGQIPAEWFARQIAEVNRTDGDIDTLSARIAQIRTWTFVANRENWLADPTHWQDATRQVEDALSDALHERLAQRFVDRRTSVLMRRLRENAMLEADITATGEVLVESHPVGRLIGFQFVPESDTGTPEGKALRAAALRALASEFANRATRVSNAVDDAFALSHDGSLRFLGEPIARLSAGEKLLAPRLRLLADDHLDATDREKVQNRIDLWLKAHVEKLLGPLLKLEEPEALTGMARGIGFQIAEALGVLDRTKVHDDMKALDQEARATLRGLGVRFGAYHLTVPALLKPAPRALACQLWALKEGGADVKGLDDILHLAASGRTSIPINPETPKPLYRAAGFRVCGTRAVRVDILERLADLIRPAIQYRPGLTQGEPPAGTADGEGFVVTVAMTSLCGCAGEDFNSILKSLGYVMDRRAGPAITASLAKPSEPATSDVTIETIQSEASTEIEDASETSALASDVVEITPTVVEETPSDAAAATEAAEPVMIEVWRQHRHRPQGQRPDRRKPHQGKPRDSEAASSPDAANATQPNEKKHFHRRSEKRSGEESESRPPRKPHAKHEGGREDRRGGQRFEGRDRNKDQARKPDRGWQDPPRAKEKDRAPDPDSPFAKLLALKSQLEGKDK